MEYVLNTLKEAAKANKLVIFVGAGVSKNSGVPTWGDIVRQFAKALRYECCENCTFQNDSCHQHCFSDYHFCTDEYIQIPQYYYSAFGKEAYIQTIAKTFHHIYQPNILDDLIAALRPSHIITTNYDHLLDNYGYEVIKRDADLLKAKSQHYLIKMHGDLDCLEELVLKEDDYLQYSETHPLIELFIKSLLIDHTFLFVGYSLNDYNLKTFLSWIDYLGRNHHVKHEMHHNFLMSVDIGNKNYLLDYYFQKNVVVIDLNHLPDSLKALAGKCQLADPVGQKVYAVLAELKRELDE